MRTSSQGVGRTSRKVQEVHHCGRFHRGFHQEEVDTGRKVEGMQVDQGADMQPHCMAGAHKVRRVGRDAPELVVSFSPVPPWPLLRDLVRWQCP
jgi:hypothetical protein